MFLGAFWLLGKFGVFSGDFGVFWVFWVWNFGFWGARVSRLWVEFFGAFEYSWGISGVG